MKITWDMSVSQADAKPEPIEIPVIFMTYIWIKYFFLPERRDMYGWINVWTEQPIQKQHCDRVNTRQT